MSRIRERRGGRAHGADWASLGPWEVVKKGGPRSNVLSAATAAAAFRQTAGW